MLLRSAILPTKIKITIVLYKVLFSARNKWWQKFIAGRSVVDRCNEITKQKCLLLVREQLKRWDKVKRCLNAGSTQPIDDGKSFCLEACYITNPSRSHVKPILDPDRCSRLRCSFAIQKFSMVTPERFIHKLAMGSSDMPQIKRQSHDYGHI